MKATANAVNLADNHWFTSAGNRLLNLLFPPRCRLCGAASLTPVPLCQPCADDLPWLGQSCPQCARPLPDAGSSAHCGRCQRQSPHFDAARALFHYHPPVDYLVKRLKFSGELALAPLFGELLAARIGQRAEDLPQQLVPVPLHPSRQCERGFNQATELARSIGRRLQVPLARHLCVRRRNTGPQSLLPVTARRLNLRDAFAVHGCSPLHVAIIDDVMTTGHTVNELARVLRRAGAERIEVWVIARAAH